MATIPYKRVIDAQGKTREVYENIMKTYGVKEPHGIYQLMGHTPEFLAASWPRSRYLFGMDTRFSIRDKHIMTLAVSATNNCEYCVRIHTDRLIQLGMAREEIVEVLTIVDVMNGYDKFAEGTRAGESPSLPIAAPGPEAEVVLEEIKRDYGGLEPEVIYRHMVSSPAYLRASWEKAKLCFVESENLSLALKYLVAFSIAATNGNDYFVRFLANRLRDTSITDDDLVEVLLIVDLTCGYNRYVQGLQIEPERQQFGADAEANKVASLRH